MYCRVILIHLFIVLSTLLGASLVPTGQVGGGDHNTMNVGGGGSDLALPAPLQLAPVAAPRPMQMSTQPSQMESMYQVLTWLRLLCLRTLLLGLCRITRAMLRFICYKTSLLINSCQ